MALFSIPAATLTAFSMAYLTCAGLRSTMRILSGSKGVVHFAPPFFPDPPPYRLSPSFTFPAHPSVSFVSALTPDILNPRSHSLVLTWP
ncbi:hypothetical protein K474DRAFT_1658112 [Panus rudis PR-1116 ss-1]|nr:hypothetical protein K474DRAFT_1658112 [Panus rudis PR-1116 ss-1]